jgi:hypothetical protein
MKKSLVKEKNVQKLEIPQLNMLNIYKLERERVYDRHKSSKKGRKEEHA